VSRSFAFGRALRRGQFRLAKRDERVVLSSEKSRRETSPIIRAQPRSRAALGSLIEGHHTLGRLRDVAARVTSGTQASAVCTRGHRHWSGRFGFISTRSAIGRPRSARLFAFRARNDVLRVSAYMQPSDRAWQIGSARVCCMCIAHRAHTYIGSSSPKVEDISGGVELPASQMGLHHAALPRAASRRLRTPFLPFLTRRAERSDAPREAAKQSDRNFRSPPPPPPIYAEHSNRGKDRISREHCNLRAGSSLRFPRRLRFVSPFFLFLLICSRYQCGTND